MRVLVLGAGVVGVTTAFQLLKDGHEVTVIDRAEEVASFSRFTRCKTPFGVSLLYLMHL